MAASNPILTLNTGAKMPAVGLGTWKSKPNEVYNAVVSAVKDSGYRHIDCAHVYQNEDEVGNALKHLFDTGVVKREELFITSKLWNIYHDPKHVLGALETTLKNLKLDYLDLYLIHWPQGYEFVAHDQLFPVDANGKLKYSDVDPVDTWKAMLELKKAGKVKSAGVSNFNPQQLEKLIKETGVAPAVNQVESHPYLPQKELIEFAKKHNIVLTAYSPLGTPDRPEGMKSANDPVLMQDPVLNEIAKKHNKSPAQVLIKFHVQRGLTVIPKSVTPSRIAQNMDIFDFELTPSELHKLENIGTSFRYCALKNQKDHKHHPWAHEP